MKTNAKADAQSIIDMADKTGFSVSVRGSIMTVTKTFTAGNSEAFRECDMMYGCTLELLPRTSPGSDWGSDGGGVGGGIAFNSGHFKMNRSGGSKRILAALTKLLLDKAK